jgi:hypothetical protein
MSVKNNGYNSQVKVLYELSRSNTSGSFSDYSSMRRSSEGLEAVIEEEEEEDAAEAAKFYEDLFNDSDFSDTDFESPVSTASFGKKQFKTAVAPEKSTKQKPKTVFV